MRPDVRAGRVWVAGRPIAGHPALRAQAGQTLVLFMLPLLLSVLLVLPGSSATALGPHIASHPGYGQGLPRARQEG